MKLALLLLVASCTPEWRATLAVCTAKAVLSSGAQLADKLLADIDHDLVNSTLVNSPVAFNADEWRTRAIGAGVSAATSELACVAAHLLDDLTHPPPAIVAGPVMGHDHRRPHERHRRHLEALARRCYVAAATTLNERPAIFFLDMTSEWMHAVVMSVDRSSKRRYSSLMAKRKPFQFHLTDNERALLEAAAEIEAAARGSDSAGLGAFIRDAALRAAKLLVEQNPKPLRATAGRRA